MIVISGTITLDPAKADAAHEAIVTLVAATRAEPGNITYEYTRDHADAGYWRVFEEWADQAAVDAHMGAPHMAEFMGAMGGFGIAGVDISTYAVDTKTKFM